MVENGLGAINLTAVYAIPVRVIFARQPRLVAIPLWVTRLMVVPIWLEIFGNGHKLFIDLIHMTLMMVERLYAGLDFVLYVEGLFIAIKDLFDAHTEKV